jgi:hypothetical protein
MITFTPTEHVEVDRATRAREPRIHSHVTGRLPDTHPLARSRVSCERCESLVHLASNSCVRTWIETGRGNFCLPCFAVVAGGATRDDRSQLAGLDCLPPSFGLGRQR